MIDVDAADLVERLYDRYRPTLAASQAADLDSLIREEALIALSELLQIGLSHDDLQSDEVEAGLRLARGGRFRRVGAHLVTELTRYQLTHFAA